MNLYSTNNKDNIVDLKEAVLKSLSKDKGLYMPCQINTLNDTFFKDIEHYSFQEISYKVARNLIGNYIQEKDLRYIVDKSINFEAPVKLLNDRLASLELWHGPSLAFKDFGARFMAQLIAYFTKNENKETTILVATSGDTGGAVGAGFLNTPGVNVVILYPKGKVSHLQEQQLTTLGNNIKAVEIDGTFDDCQAIVKEAFLNSDLNETYNLSSANSINIARLIPQSFYYFEAYKQVKQTHKNIVFSIPSGNFGNITAGVMAKKMGLPIERFIAATNTNDIVPTYLETGNFSPRPSKQTISNAMDVGNPSNFTRLQKLYSSTWNNMKKEISGYSASDKETMELMKQCYKEHAYITDPHGAIAYGSLKKYLKEDEFGIFLETAHPAKFIDTVEETLSIKVTIPERLNAIANKKGNKTPLDINFNTFKEYMLSN